VSGAGAWTWRSAVQDLATGGRLLRDLPAYLRAPVRAEEAAAAVAERLANREAALLALVRTAVLDHPPSPYRRLLAIAGCTAHDVDRLVRGEGADGALRALAAAGVYLTVDEFKGRVPVRRGGASFTVHPAGLTNPAVLPHVWAATGGSRGRRTPVPYALEAIRERAANTVLVFAARGGPSWKKAIWSVPGPGTTLRHAGFGDPVSRWFSQMDPAAPGISPRYRWSLRMLRWASLATSRPLPPVEHVPLDAPLPIARWMAAVLAAGGVPHLWAFPSSAVRLCDAAGRAGLDLRGARFTVTGEPVTPARLEAIRRAGAEAVPDYGSADAGGLVAYGCLRPAAVDDVHLFEDLVAVHQPRPPVPLPPGALLLTTLRPSTAMVLINVSLGDAAVMDRRQCGCPLEALGWPTHLSTIRSHEKLTAGGMTFLDSDAIRILEEVLPARYGGGPTDYQLVEEESADGLPRVRMLVHPAVGALDTDALAATFLAALAHGSSTARVMVEEWRRAGLPRVERRPPLVTGGGKILHLVARPHESRPLP
jgi:hypothetical protein